ncbi:uncharacterized protein JN550_011096 [Neoarthrinium moseri]|uniref:uncharacterized protein n=1 Tax=Neoarthrinium moseri TaxID=1658444 RepID=UPI001FDCB3FB|nr:uncharacterized protein JN550_011096 [Neoarthrinium moseri]KAI1860941.1 hypothetical protein JN550_011096 [Neoarthrinium moseri]
MSGSAPISVGLDPAVTPTVIPRQDTGILNRAGPTITPSWTTTITQTDSYGRPTATRTKLAVIETTSDGRTTDVLRETGTETMPLTTAFMPPSSCIGRYYSMTAFSESMATRSPVIFSDASDRLYKSCLPTATASARETVFSPGICPSLMAPVTNMAYDRQYTEVCCQSGFTWDFRGCASQVMSTTRVLVAPNITTTDIHIRVSNVVALHPASTVYWQHPDLSLFPTDVASRLREVEASLGPVSTPTPTPSTLPRSGEASDGLGWNAIIGIGVATTVVLLIVIVFTSAWAWKVKKRRSRAPRPGISELGSGHPGIWKRFLGGQWRAELTNQGQVAELEGGGNVQRNGDGEHVAMKPAELEGTIPCQDSDDDTLSSNSIAAGKGERSKSSNPAQDDLPNECAATN